MTSVASTYGGHARKLNENRPDQPPFQMRIDNNQNSVLTFRASPGGFPQISTTVDQYGEVSLELKITNTTKYRQTFKVKCTSNEIFRVRPAVGYIKRGDTITLRISYLAATTKVMPENNKHFFAIYHFKTEETGPPRELWTPTVKPEGIKRLLAEFVNPNSNESTEQRHTA